MGFLRLSCPAAQPSTPAENRRQCPRLSPEHIPAPPCRAAEVPWHHEQSCLGTARLPEGCWFWAARGAYRREVDRSGKRPRMRARESDRSTVQAGNYANYPSSHPKWLFWSIKPNHFISVLNPLVLQVKMKVVEHIVSIISTYCDCR